MNKPKLSLIILNYKNAGLVKQCVKGVLNNPSKVPLEIIVVDNNSHDNCLEIVKNNWPQVITLVAKENRGYAAGNNLGLKRAQGDYVMILNPDVAVMPDTLDKLIDFMDTHPKVGIAAPKLINPDGTVQISAYTFPRFWMPIFRRTPLGYLPRAQKALTRYLMLDWDHKDNRPVDWLLGACLIIRREALEQVGFLDERYFLYVEDTDWCRRFWQKDWQVYYVADVAMVHYHQRQSAGASFWGLFNKTTWIHITSWLKYFHKWGLQVPHPASEEK